MLQLLWSVDPAVPGPDIPAAGSSLFDSITRDAHGKQTVPFPFERLIASIEAAAGCSASHPCTRAVLIPLGRSLQRVAASPDFFAHPRVISAVVDEGDGPLLLKDRLYLGYQDKANVIEVISYNERIGRFEFQVVRNYGAGLTPTVAYARRTLCVSCHQNHGPIFSRQAWLETNANPQIAARLEQRSPSFHGISARGTADIANAIDDTTDRANRLALAQKLWLEGCGEGDSGERCRHGAFIASLQFGLTGGRAYDSTTEHFRSDVVETLLANAKARWPQGIAVPDADLVNRDPFAVAAHSGAQELVHVASRFDPLVPRAPLEVLPADGAMLADVLVKGLASFAPGAAIQELDDTLRHRADRNDAADSSEIDAQCRVTTAGPQVSFDCNSISDPLPRAARGRVREGARPNHVPGATQEETPRTQLSGSLNTTDGTLDLLSVDGSTPLRHLQLKHRHDRTFDVRDRSRAARLPNGDSIQALTVRTNATATIRIRRDFTAAFSTAMPKLAAPIRSWAVYDVVAGLQGAKHSECCADVPSVGAVANQVVRIAAPAVAFEPACGSCHRTQDSAPPNFLFGDEERVDAALDSCAARIHVRMGMRTLPLAAREKSPMPPEGLASMVSDAPSPTLPRAKRAGEGAGGESVRREVGGEEVRRGVGDEEARRVARGDEAGTAEVRRDVERRLRSEYGRVPSVAELLKQGYENLPPCLPSSG